MYRDWNFPGNGEINLHSLRTLENIKTMKWGAGSQIVLLPCLSLTSLWGHGCSVTAATQWPASSSGWEEQPQN